MKSRSRFLRLMMLCGGFIVIFGCATVMPQSESYKLSDAFFTEVQDNEDPVVMGYFYELNDYLKEGDWEMAAKSATEGIDAIPKYPELFSYFYGMRAYSSIMLFRLDESVVDIENLTRFDKESSMIPGLWTYYYFSNAPFDPDPKSYYLRAKEWLAQWQAARPRNVFEQIFSDPARIADMATVIDEELRK